MLQHPITLEWFHCTLGQPSTAFCCDQREHTSFFGRRYTRGFLFGSACVFLHTHMFPIIWMILMVNVGKCAIHGSAGI